LEGPHRCMSYLQPYFLLCITWREAGAGV
jgi:hypothetical protein